MAKVLKIWNGRGYCAYKHSDPLWKDVRANSDVHAYVAAYSRADARRVVAEYCGHVPADSEIKDYWHEGSWGDPMKEIAPERGLWLQFGHYCTPVRVI